MRKKASGLFQKIFWGSVVLIAGVLLWFFPSKKCEGLSRPLQDLSNFTGLVFFTKTKNCDERCTVFNKVVLKLYEKFPNNIAVVDSTNLSDVSTTLTKYKVDSTKIPVILSFKNGNDSPYNSFTDYDSLETYLLSIMRTVKPKNSTDRAVADLEEASS